MYRPHRELKFFTTYPIAARAFFIPASCLLENSTGNSGRRKLLALILERLGRDHAGSMLFFVIHGASGVSRGQSSRSDERSIETANWYIIFGVRSWKKRVWKLRVFRNFQDKSLPVIKIVFPTRKTSEKVYWLRNRAREQASWKMEIFSFSVSIRRGTREISDVYA